MPAGGATAVAPLTEIPKVGDQVCRWLPGPRERGCCYLIRQVQWERYTAKSTYLWALN